MNYNNDICDENVRIIEAGKLVFALALHLSIKECVLKGLEGMKRGRRRKGGFFWLKTKELDMAGSKLL